MHKIVSTMIISAALLILPLIAGAQQQNRMAQENMPMMHGHGVGGGMGMGMGPGGGACMEHEGMGMMGGRRMAHGMMMLNSMRKLDLNPDQIAKVNKIELGLRKQLWELKGKTFDGQSQLYDLYAADRPDPKKIGAVYGQLFDIRRQMIEAQINAINQASDVLTKDQQAKFRQMQQQMMGGWGMSGGSDEE